MGGRIGPLKSFFHPVWLDKITAAVLLGGPIVASFLFPLPGSQAYSARPYHVPCCLFREATNIPCPFCGLTRSFVSLSHGRLEWAFLYHPLGPAVYVAFLVGIGVVFLRKPRDGAVPPRKAASRWRTGIFVTIVLVFLAAWAAKLIWIPRSFW